MIKSLVEDKQFQIQGKTIAGQLWLPTDSMSGKHLPIIALHGFLDNSGSFNELAPRLAEFSLLALDLPGHGKSAHRSADASYNIWDDIAAIIAVSQQMNWDSFYLIGHSRGAIVAALLAAIKPQRVAKLVLLDGFMPVPKAQQEAPEQLAQAIDDSLQPPRPSHACATLRPFIQARRKGPYPLSEDAAHHLMKRGVIQSSEGYRWAHDPRLNHASQLKLSSLQIEAFVDAITCPVQLLLANQGAPGLAERSQQLCQAKSNIKTEELGGTHHFHLEQHSVEAVAKAIRSFCVLTAA